MRRCARLFKELGFDVTIVEEDTELGRQRVAEAQAEGFRATTDLVSAAKSTRVLIGATGFPSLTLAALDALPPGAIVGSVSSMEVELPMNELRDLTTSVGEARKRKLAATAGELSEGAGGEVYSVRTGAGREYVVGKGPHQEHGRVKRGKTHEHVINGKSLIILKDGRPVTFDSPLRQYRARIYPGDSRADAARCAARGADLQARRAAAAAGGSAGSLGVHEGALEDAAAGADRAPAEVRAFVAAGRAQGGI